MKDKETHMLSMKARAYGVDIIHDESIKMIASYDDDNLTFVTVENYPEIIHSIEEVVNRLSGEMRTMQHLAFTAYFCLSLFEALHDYENNLKFPPSS